ncbi:TlpA disulfide reductase family protein [uncultured Winogradskyella sp.]|uniref:TlpA family protein disulfide reductase n=1 Tax=uncultured Winogradskyella sp. TaxID=395353 RepID=UPI00263287AC|nr:TlpA disulfide reductase family protein [uncultured Winogradskyella sp.]
MRDLKFKNIAFALLFLSGSFYANSQIRVSEVLQESTIVETESNKLYFVDFWATWCGPCVYAKKLLTVLQKQYPKDFHVISLSEENPTKVERFINKNTTLLTIAIDDYGSTFKKYGVRSLPQGILFNAKGEKLWQGHPSDLKPQLLNQFLRENRTRKPLSKFLKVINRKEFSKKDYVPKKNIEVILSKISSEDFNVSYSNGYLKLNGKVKDILSYLSKVNRNQIQVSSELNKHYDVYIKKTEIENEDMDLQVLNELKLQVTEGITNGDVITLKINNPSFWNSTQINWGDVESKYLVSDSDIQADNVSIKDMAYQLSKALDLPVIVSSSNDKHLYSIHDWQIHYKYFEFMQSNLEEYGIKVKKEATDYPQYIITKKAP